MNSGEIVPVLVYLKDKEDGTEEVCVLLELCHITGAK
jgi:hypothetical protein